MSAISENCVNAVKAQGSQLEQNSAQALVLRACPNRGHIVINEKSRQIYLMDRRRSILLCDFEAPQIQIVSAEKMDYHFKRRNTFGRCIARRSMTI